MPFLILRHNSTFNVTLTLIIHVTLTLIIPVVGVVDTGEAAIRVADKHRPDLILMDTRLRFKMTGVEAANTIWEQLQIRSVFITAYSAAELEKDYRGTLPFILLEKPVLEGDLEQIIKQLFDMDLQTLK